MLKKIQEKLLRPKNAGIVCSIVFLAGLAVYAGMFTTPFALHNDYRFYENHSDVFWYFYPENTHLYLVGRYLQGIILSLQTMILSKNLIFLSVNQFLSLLVIMAGTCLYLRFLMNLNVNKVLTALLGINILLLPIVQLYVLWITQFAPGALNILLAALAYLSLEYCWDFRKTNFTKFIIYFCISIFCFVCALANYPATAFSVFIFTLSRILFSPLFSWKNTTRPIVLRDLMFFGFITVLYAAMHKFLFYPFYILNHRIDLIQYKLEFINDWRQPIPQFVHILKVSAAGVWYLVSDRMAIYCLMGFLLLLLIPAGAACWYHLKNKTFKVDRKILLYAMEAFVFIVILAALPNLPVLLARQSCILVKGFRYVYVGCVMFSVLWVWLLNYPRNKILKNSLITLYLLATFIAALVAVDNLYKVKHHEVENLNIIRDALLRLDRSKEPRNLWIVDDLDAVNNQQKHRKIIKNRFEFLFPPTRAGIVKAALLDLGFNNRPFAQFPDTSKFGTPSDYLNRTNTKGREIKTFEIINFGKRNLIPRIYFVTKDSPKPDMVRIGLAKERFWPEGKYKVLFVKRPALQVVPLEKSTDVCHDNTKSKAIDGDSESFCEIVEGPYPHRIFLKYEKPYAMNRYLLVGGELNDRCPTDWELLGSNDAKNWTLLDERADQYWGPDTATLQYWMTNHKKYRYYCFNFLRGRYSVIMRLYEIIPDFDKSIAGRLDNNCAKGRKTSANSPKAHIVKSLARPENKYRGLFVKHPPMVVVLGKSTDVCGDNTKSKAIDENAESFCEIIKGPYPHKIFLKYKEPYAINRYLLVGGELSDRCPTAWEVSGSNDGKNWTLLDKRTGQQWAPDTVLKYFIPNQEEKYYYYCFNFLKGKYSVIMRLYEIIPNFDESAADQLNKE